MTVRLLDITATAHPGGNRIDLTWAQPPGSTLPGVRVVRREGTHPAGPGDGFVVAEGVGLTAATDTGLAGERVYYYGLFPFSGAPAHYDVDPHNRAGAMATAPYDMAGLLYGLLPAIYRRYDADRTLPLRRFLELPGAELDRLYSLLRAAQDLADLDRVDGRLLPLLAQWIGWPTNQVLSVGAQRNEIRFAPRIYQTVGGVPTLDATVARVTGWANRTKEFVHNVARSNTPERLNLWSLLREPGGTVGPQALASVNFAYDGRPAVVREADGSALFFVHTRREHGWDIWAKRFADGAWQPSAPVVDRPGVDRNPAAALQGSTLWLFWQTWATDRWLVSFATRSAAGVWSGPAPFDGGVGDVTAERRLPAAVADNAGGLWVFWLERLAGLWQLRYNRHDGTHWQLGTPATLPLDGSQPPRVEDDLFVLFHPSSAGQRLWLFWARREQARWSVAFRTKAGLDPAVSDWSAVRLLPKTGAYHDRQPAALLAAGGNIELFWSSTQNGGWTLSRNTLAIGPLTWGANQRIGAGPYSQRGPVAVDTGAGTLLAYRSNESIGYASGTFGATRTLDNRYAGTTAVDTTAAAKLDLARHRAFEDFQTYSYDTGTAGGRGDGDRIARDTVGLFLTPTTGDPAAVAAARSRLAGVLPAFMPVTARAVLIT